MDSSLPKELAAIVDAIKANDDTARRLTADLDEATGTWRSSPGAWSVAECLDHLATSNREYLAAMSDAAARARAAGHMRRGPAHPGVLGRWFVGSLEPPVKTLLRAKAPANIRPSSSVSLAAAIAAYRASQGDVVQFIERNADLDLARIRFVNPLVRGIRFSVATGLHVIPAHERRHLWQAANVKAQLT